MIAYERDMNVFLETKEKYNSLREYERKKIISYLSEKGFKISYFGGTGRYFLLAAADTSRPEEKNKPISIVHNNNIDTFLITFIY